MIEIKRNKEITDRIVFEARENDSLIGTVGGVMCDDVFEFNLIECGDMLMLDGLIRALLNLMDMKGTTKARFNFHEIDINEKLRKLGFVKSDDNMIHDIDIFFTEHKNCVKK